VTDGSVSAVARAGDTIYIGGNFSLVGPRTGPGVVIDAASGQPEPNRFEVTGGRGTVEAAVGDGAGGWYIGGDFTHVAGMRRNNIAHVRADGTVDPGFDPDANDGVLALALDGSTLYAGGAFTSIGGKTRKYIAALDVSNGTATSFDANANSVVFALAVHESPTPMVPTIVYAGGYFTTIDGQTRKSIAALYADTGHVTNWVADANGPVSALALQGGTLSKPLRIYAGGQFSTIGANAASLVNVAQLDSAGDATAWNAHADASLNQSVDALAISGDTVYVGGPFFTTMGGQPRTGIAALDSTTGHATGWHPDAQGSVDAIAISGQTVYVGGRFSSIGGKQRNNIAALDATTGDATDWNPSASDDVYALAVGGGTVFAGGRFASLGAERRHGIAAIDASTGTLTNWDPETSDIGFVEALAISGRTVYAGGSFSSIGGKVRHNLAALDATTGSATDWDPSPNDSVDALAVSADGGTVYAGGFFATIGGKGRNFIAALDAATGAATDWNANANGVVRAVALSGSTLYVGGYFSSNGDTVNSIGGQHRDHIAALNTTTGAATDWNPKANGAVNAIAIAGGTVYVGGLFSSNGDTVNSIGGQHRDRIAALDAAGNATSWNPKADQSVDALAIVGDLVYAGGSFTSIGSKKRQSLAALRTTTGVATDWDPEPSSTVWTLAAAPDGSLYAGGQFDTTDLAAQAGFASFSEPPANNGLPMVGAVHVGQPAACATGTWLGSTPQHYDYVWLRDGTPIPAAATASYVPVLGDAGHALACRVTAHNIAGSASATSTPVVVPPAPSAATGAATGIGPGFATLNATANPHGEATSAHFEFGTTTAYGAATPTHGVGAGTVDEGIATVVSGLSPATTYHFRVVAVSASGIAYGADGTFTTLKPNCRVPKLRGKPLRGARKAIVRAHCRTGKIRRAYSRRVKKGRVISQRPRPGKVLPNGGKINLVVSRGRKHVK
jgi:hypothetical protein